MVKALWDGEFTQLPPSLVAIDLKMRANGGITN
jgi:hypothetical protein